MTLERMELIFRDNGITVRTSILFYMGMPDVIPSTHYIIMSCFLHSYIHDDIYQWHLSPWHFFIYTLKCHWYTSASYIHIYTLCVYMNVASTGIPMTLQPIGSTDIPMTLEPMELIFRDNGITIRTSILFYMGMPDVIPSTHYIIMWCFLHLYTHNDISMTLEPMALLHMGWLRLVGSFKLQVSFAKEPYKRDYIHVYLLIYQWHLSRWHFFIWGGYD